MTFFTTSRRLVGAGLTMLAMAGGTIPAAAQSAAVVSSSTAALDSATAKLSAARTPAACVDAVRAERSAAQAALTQASVMRAEREARTEQITTTYRAHAADCAKQFSAESVALKDFESLVLLYRIAKLDANVDATYARRIDKASSPAARDSALQSAITYYGDIYATPGRIAIGEQYAARIDTLRDVSTALKVRAHVQMVDPYPISAPEARRHTERALAAARALTAAERRSSRAYVIGLTTAADLEMSDWHPERAIALLEEGVAALHDDTAARARANLKELTQALQRYQLVGKPAAAIAVDYWLTPAAAVSTAKTPSQRNVPLTGGVALLEFTSPSCVWCREGYPVMRRMHTKYESQGARLMFVSGLEGDAYDKPATVPEELAYRRKYWIENDSVTFPIGIIETAETKNPDGSTRREDPPIYKAYGVSGFPGYVFVDRRGIVRYVQAGHTRDLEARFSAILERLLKEPS
jgi:hypothetical protein